MRNSLKIAHMTVDGSGWVRGRFPMIFSVFCTKRSNVFIPFWQMVKCNKWIRDRYCAGLYVFGRFPSQRNKVLMLPVLSKVNIYSAQKTWCGKSGKLGATTTAAAVFFLLNLCIAKFIHFCRRHKYKSIQYKSFQYLRSANGSAK